MTKSILAAALALVAVSAGADIRPPHPRPVSQDVAIAGNAARDLYQSLKGASVKDMPGDSLRTLSSSYRVFEAEDSLARIICRETVHRSIGGRPGSTEYDCTVQISKNGQPLQRFIPPRRIG